MTEMTLSELKTGMIVTLRCGWEGLVLKDTALSDKKQNYIVSIVSFNPLASWMSLDSFNEDMTFNRALSDTDAYDIMRVCVPRSPAYTLLPDILFFRSIIWTREEKEDNENDAI